MSWTIRDDNNKIPEATLTELRNIVWPEVTDPNGLDYLFPGSSLATALAAGLAVLLIHCTKPRHYYVNGWKGPEARRKETITQQFVDQIATSEGMQNALDNLSSGSRSGAKYANPSRDFACALQDLRQYDVQGGAANNLPQSLKPIATLCRNLCRIWRLTHSWLEDL
ncbi:hypothetical protein BDP55DRAFT_633535 [Colletotrichum godetiae]|uniref:Uncharacterized protein n=1 Tax=Colletotrichum godetiae TaxID=1209918 RepID=A0AAJ0ERH3_9PEZI|nr:uncharacterized protein BDP55DRAFT_633535 [Colletotrichum godetiae]KAK1673926.1 hypothetical protein BDP55DRAFT_633535 [Colletotrichum godetiae]